MEVPGTTFVAFVDACVAVPDCCFTVVKHSDVLLVWDPAV